MSETGLTCRTFCNRLFKCSQFKESEDYVKMSRLLFERILKKYRADTTQSLVDIFAREFTNKSFTGIRIVYSEHTMDYKRFYLDSITNLNEFFQEFNPTHIMDPYNYKFKIKGTIGCQIPGFNVQFFYKNLQEVEKDLDFACLNSYIYNQVNGLSNACLVMSVPTNVFYLMDYNEKDYTMGRGFFTQTKRTHIKRRGSYCNRCVHSCKPLFINGLDRLEMHL